MNLFDTFAEAEAALAENEVVTFAPNRMAQYATQQFPQIGDEVSMSFNGDSYHVGTIASISKSGEKIVTSTGNTFRRPRKAMTDNDGRVFKQHGWTDGCFWLVLGIHEERNPSF